MVGIMGYERRYREWVDVGKYDEALSFLRKMIELGLLDEYQSKAAEIWKDKKEPELTYAEKAQVRSMFVILRNKYGSE